MSRDDHQIRPHDLEAERTVLGCIVLDASGLAGARELLAAADFYLEAHRKIWTLMLELAVAERPVDYVTLQNAATAKGILEEIGGIATLAALADFVPESTRILHYARIVAEKARCRRVLDVADLIREEAAEGASADRLHEMAIGMVATSEPPVSGSSLLFARESVQALVAHQDMIAESVRLSNSVTAIDTPWPALSALIGGGWKGGRRPYVIAAQEKVGKTQVLLLSCLHAARQGRRVLLCEIELNHIQTMARLCGLVSGVNSAKIETWVKLTDDESQRVIKAMEEIHELPIWIDAKPDKRVMGYNARPAVSVLDMRSRYDRLLRDGFEPELIGIDYYQKMSPNQGTKSRDERERLVNISEAIADWSTGLSCPVLVLAQCLSRGENRGEAPTAKDIYGSSQIAKDASTVIIADRPPLRKTAQARQAMTDCELEEAQLIVDIEENGNTGIVECRHQKENGLWEPVWSPSGKGWKASRAGRPAYYSDEVIYGTGHEEYR